MEKASPSHVLGVAGKLPVFDDQVVPAVESCIDAEFSEGHDNGLCHMPEIQTVWVFAFEDEGEIQVPQVVVNGTPAGHPPDHVDAEFFYRLGIDLFQGVLEPPDDDRRLVAPEKKIAVIFAVYRLKEDLFQSQVEARISAGVFDVFHGKLS